MQQEALYLCPCCGTLVFNEPPGSYAICLICYWEDEVWGLHFIERGGGANKVSLLEAQQNYLAFGASEKRVRGCVRSPRSDEQRDPAWRPIDLAVDRVSDTVPYDPDPLDPTKLYYWKTKPAITKE